MGIFSRVKKRCPNSYLYRPQWKGGGERKHEERRRRKKTKRRASWLGFLKKLTILPLIAWRARLSIQKNNVVFQKCTLYAIIKDDGYIVRF